jgi:hypothetical protein
MISKFVVFFGKSGNKIRRRKDDEGTTVWGCKKGSGAGEWKAVVGFQGFENPVSGARSGGLDSVWSIV